MKGKNPFESAALGSAILHGPEVQDFAESYQKLRSAGASRTVETVAELAHEITALSESTAREALTQAAAQVITNEAQVLDKTWDAIRAHLP